MNEWSQQLFISQIKQMIIKQQQLHKASNADSFIDSMWTFLAEKMFQQSQHIIFNKKLTTEFSFFSKAKLKKELAQVDIKSLIMDISRLSNKIKYVFALSIVLILSQNKQKPLSIILGFYYELLNSLIRQLKNDQQESKKTGNRKISAQQLEKTEEINRFCTTWIVQVYWYLIEASNVQKQQSRLGDNQAINFTQAYITSHIAAQDKFRATAFKPSKIMKIVASILCIPQRYLPTSSLIQTFTNLIENYSHSDEILSRVEYKLVNKLEKYQQKSFSQQDIVSLVNIVLHAIESKAGKIVSSLFDLNLKAESNKSINENNKDFVQRHPQLQKPSQFMTQDKVQMVVQLTQLLSQGLSKVVGSNSQKDKKTHHFGYHLTCFIVKIISKSSIMVGQFSSLSSQFLKQLVFFLSTNYLHHLHSFTAQKQSIKFYNTIISCLINENNVFILKGCLNFIQNQAILNFSVHKLKSLFKLLTDIAKKLKKMDPVNYMGKSNKSLKSDNLDDNKNVEVQAEQSKYKKLKLEQVLINQQVELAKLKISRILRIFEQLTQRYRDKSSQLVFSNCRESILELDKIKSTNSLFFCLKINDRRKLHPQRVLSNQQVRLIKFVIGKSETYEVFVQIKQNLSTDNASKLKRSDTFSVMQMQSQDRNFLNELFSSKQPSFKVDIFIFLDQKLLVQDQLRNIEKVAESYFDFTICISCNKSTNTKGSNIFFKINEKLISVPSKQKRNEITSLELGLRLNSQTYAIDSVVKQMYFFNKEIPEEMMGKNDFSSLTYSVISLIQYMGGIESITYRISASNEELFQNVKKEQSLFFKKQIKVSSLNIQKRRSVSFVEIFQQIGGLNSIFYILDKINKSYSTHFGEKTQYFFIQLFKILKNVASNDRENFIFKYLKTCYSYICHFLVLIFRRNEHLANQRNSLFVQAIFKFLMFFSGHFTKNETIKQYPLEEVFEMELTFIKEVLCHFELWSQCSLEIQSYVFKTLQEYIKNERYTFALFPIDLHSKILSSVTFFYSQEPHNLLKNKFEQKILILCEIMYDKIFSLLYDEKNNLETTYNLELLIYLLKRVVQKEGRGELAIGSKDKSQKQKGQNKQGTTRRDLINLFERYVHRDVNGTISLIYLLLIYHSKHFADSKKEDNVYSNSPSNQSPKHGKNNPKTSMISFSSQLNRSFISSNSTSNSSFIYLPASLRTCSNLLSYFSKNFLQKDQIFSKINDDWAYVLGILSMLQQVLLETRINSKKTSSIGNNNGASCCEFFFLSKVFDLMFKIVMKKQTFYNYLINSLDKVLTFDGLSFLEVFSIASEILNLNKKHHLDIVDTVFFLVNKKITSLDQGTKIKQLCQFLSENELEKILYKMADATLTYSREFEDFMLYISKEIQELKDTYFCQKFFHKESFISIRTENNQKQMTELIVGQAQQKTKSEQTIIENLKLNEFIFKQSQDIPSQREITITRSRQSLKQIFTQYEDILFSICYQTATISLQNRQWIEGYFSRKYSQSPSSVDSRIILKDKRINIDSNLLIAHFCSSTETIRFVLDLLHRICQQQISDAEQQEKLLRNSLPKILEIQPRKELASSVSSRGMDKQQFYIETEQKINQQISQLLYECQPISFFFSSPMLSQPQIYILHKSINQFLKSNLKYSQFATKSSLSLLSFVKSYSFAASLNYLLQKYSHNEENLSLVEKPIDAVKRKENTLHALEIISQLFQQKQIDQEGLYNCLLSESQIVVMTAQKVLIEQRNILPQDKRLKIIKQTQLSLKKILQAWYMNNNPAFRVNPHDRQRIKTPKKLILQEKNIYDTLMDKLRFICLKVDTQEQKITELFTFLTQNTRGNQSKQFLSLLNRIIFTLKYVVESKRLLTELQNYKIFNEESYLISCPKNPAAILSKQVTQEYREQLVQRFNKILQVEKKKADRSQNEYKKNDKENQFWLQIQQKDYERKDLIYELDQKQIGPFGFYKLNIKPSQENIEQIHYPRKKMFTEMKNSESSQQFDEQNNGDDSLLLTRTRLIDLSFENNDNDNRFDRRNTLLSISPVKLGTLNKIDLQRNSVIPNNQAGGSIQFLCEWVTKRGVYAGKLIVKAEWIEFKYLSHFRLPEGTVYRLSTGKFHQINSLTEEEQSRISSMRIPFKRCRLFTRRYIMRHTAVELFSKSNHQSYFFNFFIKQQCQRFLTLTRERFEEFLQDRSQQFIKKKFTQQWQIGQLSNFQYICLINQYSGRSTNDLAQYYVFPWVIKNYNGKNGFVELDDEFLANKENLRDLKCPPGKLSEQKFIKLKTRLMQLDFCGPEQRFLYGTMFSNPTVLYNFFIRLQPYIHLHWQHQGKRIDHADRLFSSIEQQFSSVLIASSDMKQLTPEFYYWPQFLKNRSYIDLGQKQNKQQVDDVILPPWAHSPQEFIFRMRYVLQSNVVSQHLHEWIDLTFGYKILYQNAEQNDNLYHFNCYERELDYFEEFQGNDKEIRSLQVSISEFGQIPEAVFYEPHPLKNLRHQFLIIDRFINVKYEKTHSKYHDQKLKIGFETCPEGIFIWTTSSVEFKKSYINQNYSYDEEHKVFPSIGEMARLLSFEDQCWLTLNQGILRIYMKRILKYTAQIEAQCIDVIGSYLVYSKKSSLYIGQYDGVISKLINKKTLFGHKEEIIYVACAKSLDLILSVDLEGFVIVHELQNLVFLRNFQLPLEKEWSQNDIRNQSLRKNILKVQIHEMGYFIFLLNQRKLVVVTFLGEIFLEHDIEITSQSKGKREEEKITDMLIFRQDQSIILLGTDKGNIYEIDFIDIKRYNQLYPYKTFTNIQANVLEFLLSQNHLSVTKSTVGKKSISSETMFQKAIYRMTIEKIAGDKISLYQLIVQYEDGEILCFYEEKYLGKQLKQNEKLKQIGLFF